MLIVRKFTINTSFYNLVSRDHRVSIDFQTPAQFRAFCKEIPRKMYVSHLATIKHLNPLAHHTL
jgi:hypothetical protein